MDEKLPFRCRWGFHKWIYVGWPNHPFHSLPLAAYWRGCVLCHKDEYEGQCHHWQHKGGSGMSLCAPWTPVPDMHDERAWKQFQHPSGWTDMWLELPFEGLQSLATVEEINKRIRSINDWI